MKTVLLCALLAVLASLTGCGSADPFVVNSIEQFKQSDIVLMDDYDRMAVKAGEPKLPQEYRDNRTGAKDDLIKYLKGEKPKAER